MNFQRKIVLDGGLVLSVPYQPATFEKGADHIMRGFNEIPIQLKFETVIDKRDVYSAANFSFEDYERMLSENEDLDYFDEGPKRTRTIKLMKCSISFVQLFDAEFFRRLMRGLSKFGTSYASWYRKTSITRLLLKNER